jgi:CO dehydrogenase nickel-insertion accessory protein CooC1
MEMRLLIDVMVLSDAEAGVNHFVRRSANLII